MKFGQPLLSTELSGALGGVVGATARGGVGYFRRRVTGSNPSSPNQSVTRSVIATLAGLWQNTLTSVQRASWVSKADPAESGIDVFTRANFQQLLSGIAAHATTAPATVALDNTPITTVGNYDISDGQWEVAIPADSEVAWNVFVSAPQSASRLSRQFNYTYNQNVQADQAAIDISATVGKLAGIAAGQVFYVRLVPFGDAAPKLGRVGQAQEFRVVAQA